MVESMFLEISARPIILPMALLDTENVPSDEIFVALMHKHLPTRIYNLGIDALCSF